MARKVTSIKIDHQVWAVIGFYCALNKMKVEDFIDEAFKEKIATKKVSSCLMNVIKEVESINEN